MINLTHKGTIELEGKRVNISKPYKAASQKLVGRKMELNTIAASWSFKNCFEALNPVLVGAPGIGKNQIVYEAAKITGRDLYILQGHNELSPEDLVCSARFSDNRKGAIEYSLSPLATAMVTGGIAFIDEVAKMNGRTMANLVSILDHRRYVDSLLLGIRIEAHPAFRIICATNNSDLESNLWPDYIRSRVFPFIKVAVAGRDEVETIVKNNMNSSLLSFDDALFHYWNVISDKEINPSPRDALQIFKMALSFAAIELENSEIKIEAKHIDMAFDMKGE